MTERLRLEAEFRDRGVAVGLRKISGELKEVRRTPGMNQAKEWMEKFTDRSKEFVTEGGGVGGVLKGIGLGGLLAASSLGELVTSFRELGERTAGLKEVARQTGLTIDQVNELQRAGQRLHIDPGQMTTGLEHLSSQMFDFKRHWGELWGQLNDQGYGAFAQKLSLDKPLEQVQDIVKFLGQIKDPELQKRWTELFFGTGDMSRVLVNGGRDFAAAFKEAQEHAAKITPEMQRQQEEFEKAIQGFDDSWTDFQTTVGPTVFANLSKAADEFKAVFADIKEAYEWVTKAKEHPAEAVHGAVDSWLKDQEKQNEEARAKGKGPWVDLPGAALDAQRNGKHPSSRGEDGNALRRGDEMPAQPPAKSKGWFGGLFGGSVEHTAFTSGDSSAGSFGVAAIMSGAVKQGTLAAFRELMQQREMGDGAGAGGGGGIQNASFETGAGSPGSGGRGSSGRGGSDDGSLPAIGKGVGHYFSAAAREANIRSYSAAIGINPEYAMRVSRSEGFNTFTGDQGTSFGDFQMHIKNNKPGLSLGGLGDLYRKATGKSPWDPKNELELDRYALDQAKKGGWSPWHGASAHGIYGYAGINRGFASKNIPPLPNDESREPSGFKLPKGGSWGKDADGNPVAIGPDGQSIQMGRRRQMNLPEAAKGAGAGRMSVEHSGGAEITIKGLPQGTSTQTKTKGLITAVNLQRGPTMISANV